MSLVHKQWTLPQVARLLEVPQTDARKCAALVMSLIGKPCCLSSLAGLLRDGDAVASQMAEHAIWSIWLRCGNDQANTCLARGTQEFARRNVDAAIVSFTHAIAADPDFAEAYNQRAMAYYVKEMVVECRDDCLKTVERMPIHFGAWAGLGHCHVALGELPRAVECYRRAKEINPHLECVDDLIAELTSVGPG